MENVFKNTACFVGSQVIQQKSICLSVVAYTLYPVSQSDTNRSWASVSTFSFECVTLPCDTAQAAV